jgi:hypothetical protein
MKNWFCWLFKIGWEKQSRSWEVYKGTRKSYPICTVKYKNKKTGEIAYDVLLGAD